MSENPPVKRCYACKKFFPATSEFFCRNKSKKDGLHDTCKVCDSARRKAYTESHREQESQSRKHFRENNKDRLREEQRLYREANKEKVAERKKQWQQGESYKEYQKQYQQGHKLEISEQKHQYYLSNREQFLEKQRQYLQTPQGRMVDKAHRHNRKAQKRASQGSYTSEQLNEQFQRQKAKCYYCKKKLGKVWHADHVVPLSKGGSNTIDNIVVACEACNLHKSAKLLHEWPEGGRLL
jgi:5-methylcytosine-specific restriction endonuclease McrA